MQIGILKKPQPKEFNEMGKAEKKNFLACDLIERMIRIEQKVRGSMGEGVVPYQQTEYFRELTPGEKRKYIEYLENKEKKKKWKFLPFVLIPGAGAFVGLRVTGNVVSEGQSVQPINLILLGVFLAVVVAYWIYILSKRKRFRRLDRHFKVIEHIIAKRRVNRR
jgi:hypothetical protein